jgi:hypothetical protein
VCVTGSLTLLGALDPLGPGGPGGLSGPGGQAGPLALLVPGTARADGDPASDMLIAENVFLPYQPPVAASLVTALNAQVAAAHRAGLPIKVALIGGPIDLGAIPQLFGRPQTYARFLERELDYTGPKPLLVVMPAGDGAAAIRVPGATAAATAASLPRPRGPGSNALARAAILAVARLADASGHPVAAVHPPAGTAAGSATPVIVAVLIAAALLVTVALMRLRPGRPRPRRPRPGGTRPRRPRPRG